MFGPARRSLPPFRQPWRSLISRLQTSFAAVLQQCLTARHRELYNLSGTTAQENTIMSHQTLANRGLIVIVLILQVIPIMLFPAASFAPNSQEWWLPLLLTIMVVVGDLQLILRRSTEVWPWHLISFSHGFNIISRLMMIWPHATRMLNGQMVINGPYVSLSCISMAISGFLLYYLELPEGRIAMVR
jgi:hypothetical protein